MHNKLYSRPCKLTNTLISASNLRFTLIVPNSMAFIVMNVVRACERARTYIYIYNYSYGIRKYILK